MTGRSYHSGLFVCNEAAQLARNQGLVGPVALQKLVVLHHTGYLSKHNFVRLRVPDSFHTSLLISEVEPFENEWRRILDRVPGRLMAKLA
jgi:hypothetical protein